MGTQQERRNFNWRPNDNSSTTLTKYDLESQHWVRALKNNKTNNSNNSIGEMTNFLGLVFSFTFSVILLFLFLLTNLIKWLKND